MSKNAVLELDGIQAIHNLFWNTQTGTQPLSKSPSLNVLPTRRVDGMKAEIAELISEKLCRLPKGEGRVVINRS